MCNHQCPLQKDELVKFGEASVDLGNLESFHDTCRFLMEVKAKLIWLVTEMYKYNNKLDCQGKERIC